MLSLPLLIWGVNESTFLGERRRRWIIRRICSCS
jgi:hypothetical protein